MFLQGSSPASFARKSCVCSNSHTHGCMCTCVRVCTPAERVFTVGFHDREEVGRGGLELRGCGQGGEHECACPPWVLSPGCIPAEGAPSSPSSLSWATQCCHPQDPVGLHSKLGRWFWMLEPSCQSNCLFFQNFIFISKQFQTF